MVIMITTLKSLETPWNPGIHSYPSTLDIIRDRFVGLSSALRVSDLGTHEVLKNIVICRPEK